MYTYVVIALQFYTFFLIESTRLYWFKNEQQRECQLLLQEHHVDVKKPLKSLYFIL